MSVRLLLAWTVPALLLASLGGCAEEVEVASSSDDGGNNAANNAANNGQNNNNTNNAANNSDNSGGNSSANNAANNAANNGQNNPDNNANNHAHNHGQNHCTADEQCEAGHICLQQQCVPWCDDHSECQQGQICTEDHRCVECRDDDDCSLGTVCEADACVAGCRGDAGCERGQICAQGQCADGCRDDAACGAGQLCDGAVCAAGCRADTGCEAGMICQDAACAPGCRDDAACALGQLCQDAACAPGCRTDEGCPQDQLCVGQACLLRGVVCRTDADCAGGNICDPESAACVAGQTPCEPDAYEPNGPNDAPTPLTTSLSGLTLCPGDEDHFSIQLQEGDTLELAFQVAPDAPSPLGQLTTSDAISGLEPGLRLVASRAESASLRVFSDAPEARLTYAISLTITAAPQCVDTTLYADTDADGFGDAQAAQTLCLDEGESPEGYTADASDCAPADGWRHPGAHEICGDNVDDDCQGGDRACPTSQPGVMVPAWDCENDSPPTSVYAWAKFEQDQPYFQAGGCFVFFEGLAGEFYVKHNLQRANASPDCAGINGCTCPSLNGWPSYDRRMYAFTQDDNAADCEEVSIVDHGGQTQPVSNACRKYLYQLHYYNIPYSYLATGVEALRQRLDAFPTVEVACAEDYPHRNLPFASLMSAPIVYNVGYQPGR
jgi:hypothetical protein